MQASAPKNKEKDSLTVSLDFLDDCLVTWSKSSYQLLLWADKSKITVEFDTISNFVTARPCEWK